MQEFSKKDLEKAAMSGNTKLLLSCLEYGIHIETKLGEYKSTALILAANNGHLACVKILLENGANIEATNKNGTTSLLLASRNKRTDVVLYLLNRNANAKSENKFRKTPLKWIFKNYNTNFYLITTFCKNESFDFSTKEEIKIWNECIEKKYKNDMLYFLAGGGLFEESEKKIQYFEDIKSKKPFVFEKDVNGNTALLTLAANGKKFLVDWLIKNGASTAEKNHDGNTALLLATDNDNLSTVECLIKHGAFVNAKNNKGNTPLLLASAKGKKYMVNFLIENGAFVNEKNHDGNTALLLSVLNGYYFEPESFFSSIIRSVYNIRPLYMDEYNGEISSIVKNLIDRNASIIEKNNKGETPLSVTAKNKKIDILEFFLRKRNTNLNCDFLKKDDLGKELLFIAAKEGRIEIIKWLTNNSIILDETDKDGNTPLHLALINLNYDVAFHLVLEGANIKTINHEGLSPLKILMEFNEMHFTEKMKDLFALMIYRKPINIINKTSEFTRVITNKRDIIAQCNEYFSQNLASILATHIISNKHNITLDKKSIETDFMEMLLIPELEPLLKITLFALLGYHNLRDNMPQSSKCLIIVVDPKKETTEKVSCGDTKNAYGVYYHNNKIYLGWNRDSRLQARGTLIHEITHFVSNEIFKNNCKPYFKGDAVNEKIFENICQDIKNRKNNLNEILCEVFNLYDSSDWHIELIVRVSQLVAMAKTGKEYDVVKEDCPELLKYYQEVFLPACYEHIYKLCYKNAILGTSLVRKSSAKILEKEERSLVIENPTNFGILSNRALSKYAFYFFDTNTLKIAACASRNSYLIGNEINNECKTSRNFSMVGK